MSFALPLDPRKTLQSMWPVIIGVLPIPQTQSYCPTWDYGTTWSVERRTPREKKEEGNRLVNGEVGPGTLENRGHSLYTFMDLYLNNCLHHIFCVLPKGRQRDTRFHKGADKYGHLVMESSARSVKGIVGVHF